MTKNYLQQSLWSNNIVEL